MLPNQMSFPFMDGPPADADAPPPTNGTATSAAAADFIRPVTGPLRKKVYECILKSGMAGMTTEEIEEELSMSGSTARPRVVELRDDFGAIVPHPEGLTRQTRSGCQAVVHVAVRALPRGD